jgi:non-ribosomal peptide synthetase component F
MLLLIITLRAVEARLEWASKDMFGGGPLMAALMACLISGAAELKQQPEGEQQALADVSRRVLEHVVQQQRNNLASLVLDGHPETATAVTAALRGLPQPSST